MFGTDTIVRHHKDLARLYASHWTLATANYRNFAFRWYITSSLLGPARNTQGYIKDTPVLIYLGQDKCQMLVISSGQIQQTDARRQGHTGWLYNDSPE